MNVWESPIRHTLSGSVLLHSALRELTAELAECFVGGAHDGSQGRCDRTRARAR